MEEGESVPGTALRWSVHLEPPRSGPANMALDHALAETLARGRGALRLYRWTRPTVSFGRNEPARELYDPSAARREGVGLVRRPTGGRAVLHHRELTYAVALPLRAFGGLREAYHRIHEGLVQGLRSLGVSAELVPPGGRAPSPAEGVCFQTPAPGEVTVGGRKLVGSAQVRIGSSLLQHGSLLLEGNQDLVERLRRGGRAGGGGGSACLADHLDPLPSWERIGEAVLHGLKHRLGGEWGLREVPPRVRLAAADLRERYESEEWTWRR